MRIERDVVVGQVRRTGWVRIGRGLYRREAEPPNGPDLPVWQAILPGSGCFTHLTAARVHRMWLPPLPSNLPIFVSMSDREHRLRRPELTVMRHTKPIASGWVGGARVATAEETLLACARHLSLLDLVVLGDSAIHLGLTSVTRLSAAGQRRRWGASRLARAVGWMDGRSESAWESLLRVMHRACGVPVVPQHVVRDAAGGFVARGDLWIAGSRMLHEYDGAVHHEAREYARGLDRDRRLLDADWRRRGYTAYDLMARPERILREADDTLGRRHRVDRLDPWLRLHEESLFHERGQAAFQERLGQGDSGRELHR
jgi:hypothetical protein